MKSRRRLRTNVLTAYVVAIICIFFWRQLQWPPSAPTSERVENALIFISDFDPIDASRRSNSIYRIATDGSAMKRVAGSIPHGYAFLRISDIDCERESQQLIIASHEHDLNGFHHALLDGTGLHFDQPGSGDPLRATRQIAIAPDGRRVIVSRQDPDFAEPRFGLVAGDLGSRQYASIKTPSNERAYLAPDWSPDSAEIAYVIELWETDSRRSWQLAISRPSGADERIVFESTSVISAVAWAPTGEWLALSMGRQVWRVRPDGSDLQQLTNHHNGAWSPRWSPDGRKISFVAGSTFPGQHQLLVMEADGTNPRRVTTIRGDVLNGCWV